MAKVYTQRYTSTAVPRAKPAIVVTNTKLKSVAVPFPSEGYITKLVITQTGGTPKAAVVELLNSKVPYPPGEQAVATSPADNIELYRIIPSQTIVSGTPFESALDQWGHAYLNADGTFTNNQRFIYLVIKPTASADDTTWDVAIVGHSDIG